MPLAEGIKLGRYEIRAHIGTGGMGQVYLAQDTSELNRTVAIKLLPLGVAADPWRTLRSRAFSDAWRHSPSAAVVPGLLHALEECRSGPSDLGQGEKEFEKVKKTHPTDLL